MPSLSLLRTLLPFSEEPLQAWNENSDILAFLCGLTDSAFAAEYRKGQTSYYPAFGLHVFGRSSEQMEDFGAKLSLSAEYASDHYSKCAVFGGFAKAYAAWDGILSEVLGEDRMFSVPHTLESESHLKAVMTNLIDYNYRHAFAALRLFLEDLVKPLVWIDRPDEFKKWIRGQPEKRLIYTGRASSLLELVRNGTTTDDIRTRFEEFYRDLSGYVHGEENKITHSGIGRRSWHGHRFNAELVQQCLRKGKGVVELGIELMDSQVTAWSLKRQSLPRIFCDECHSCSPISSKPEFFGPVKRVRYTCETCGNSWVMDEV